VPQEFETCPVWGAILPNANFPPPDFVDSREGEPLDPGRLRLMVARVVYKPDANRVAVNWQKDRD
jgi:hypothetical protein